MTNPLTHLITRFLHPEPEKIGLHAVPSFPLCGWRTLTPTPMLRGQSHNTRVPGAQLHMSPRSHQLGIKLMKHDKSVVLHCLFDKGVCCTPFPKHTKHV
jgi:hypothetical protein